MRYLLDTNILIYFLKGKYNLADKFEEIGFQNLFISEITVAELKYGAAKSGNPKKNNIVVNSLIENFKLIPIYKSLDIYADEKARLKNEGQIIDDFDLLIGSTAISNNMILVTNNIKHFERLNHIDIENWVINN